MVKIDVNGRTVKYEFKINGEGGTVLKNSAVLTVTRSSFTVAAPDGEVWYQYIGDPDDKQVNTD